MKDNGKFSKLKGYWSGYFADPQEENENETESAGGSKSSYDNSQDYDKNGSSGYSYEDVKSSSTGAYSSRYSSSASSYSSGTAFDSQSSSANVYKMGSKPVFKLSVVKPLKLEDAVKIADNILDDNVITLVTFHSVSKDVMRRIIDFLDGVRYTCNARMENVFDNYTYVVAPKGVELTGDLFDKIDTTNI